MGFICQKKPVLPVLLIQILNHVTINSSHKIRYYESTKFKLANLLRGYKRRLHLS